MKKSFAIILLFACVCAALFSCSRTEYTDSKSCESICKRATDTLGDGFEYAEFGETHVSYYFDDSDLYDDLCLIYSTDTNDINEIGVFHATDSSDAKKLEELCVDYIEEMREGERAFIASYAPDELPKLDGAKVTRFGNYVIYTILPTSKADAVLDGIADMLKK